ncbi:MAG: hypothetical protein BAJATHORv1_40130 [Candidatus Thorarchaeota archaeon]|nr:MAG: hypothetical protein BAJATHORv1_40130 [Candidatus Thorarchaeota archaeon]
MNADVRDELIETLDTALAHTRYLEEEGERYEAVLYSGIGRSLEAILRLLTVTDAVTDYISGSDAEAESVPVEEAETTIEEVAVAEAEMEPTEIVEREECAPERKNITSRVLPEPGDGLPAQRIAQETLVGPDGSELRRETMTYLGKIEWSGKWLTAKGEPFVVTTSTTFTAQDDTETKFELRRYNSEEALRADTDHILPIVGEMPPYWDEDSGLWALVVSSGDASQLEWMKEVDIIRNNINHAMRLFYRATRIFSMKRLCGEHVEATFPDKY